MEEERDEVGALSAADLIARQLGYENDAEYQRMLDQAARHVEQLEMEEQTATAEPEVVITTASTDTSQTYQFAEEEPVKRKPVKKKAKTQAEIFQETILRIATEYIGEENVCIERVPEHEFTALIIKWPEINMVNRRNQRHTIKDMVVAMPFNNRGTAFDRGLHGARMTLSHVEYHSGYRHSHLYHGIQGLTHFCTGADGINDLWSSLIIDGINSQDFELRFEGFLHQMYSFLSYESLEGVPYTRINNIGYRSHNHYGGARMTRDMRNMLASLSESSIDISMDYNTGEVQIVETDHLHDVLASSTSTHQYREPNGMYSDVDGTTNGRPRSFSGEYLEGVTIPFKGQQVKVYVEPIYNDEEEEPRIERKKYAHNFATGRIFQEFEKQGGDFLQQTCLQNYVQEPAEKEGKAHSWKRFDGANRLLPCTSTESGVERSSVLEDERGGGSGESGDDSN